MTDLTVKLKKTIHAPPDKVFDAWLDPAMLTRFILPMIDMPPPEVTNDPREGGRFEIIMHVGDDNRAELAAEGVRRRELQATARGANGA